MNIIYEDLNHNPYPGYIISTYNNREQEYHLCANGYSRYDVNNLYYLINKLEKKIYVKYDYLDLIFKEVDDEYKYSINYYHVAIGIIMLYTGFKILDIISNKLISYPIPKC